jgi:MOSC domain-containing protein YiiM
MPRATIVSIAFNPVKGLPRPLHPSAELAAGHGIVGDHRAGVSENRALNILDERQVQALVGLGYDVRPGSLGENLLVAGLDVDALPPGTRLQLGPAAVARVVKPRTGCPNLTYIHEDFPAVAEGRLGQMCAMERGGPVVVGDPVLVLPDPTVPEY